MFHMLPLFLTFTKAHVPLLYDRYAGPYCWGQATRCDRGAFRHTHGHHVCWRRVWICFHRGNGGAVVGRSQRGSGKWSSVRISSGYHSTSVQTRLTHQDVHFYITCFHHQDPYLVTLWWACLLWSRISGWNQEHLLLWCLLACPAAWRR